MKKKLVITGADFSANGINSNGTLVPTYQGLLNTANSPGAVEPNNVSFYSIRVFMSKTVAVAPGDTITLGSSVEATGVILSSILKYNKQLNFNKPTSTRDTSPMEFLTDYHIYSDVNIPVGEYSYTNESDGTEYIALCFKKTDGSTFPQSSFPSVYIMDA